MLVDYLKRANCSQLYDILSALKEIKQNVSDWSDQDLSSFLTDMGVVTSSATSKDDLKTVINTVKAYYKMCREELSVVQEEEEEEEEKEIPYFGERFVTDDNDEEEIFYSGERFVTDDNDEEIVYVRSEEEEYEDEEVVYESGAETEEEEEEFESETETEEEEEEYESESEEEEEQGEEVEGLAIRSRRGRQVRVSRHKDAAYVEASEWQKRQAGPRGGLEPGSGAHYDRGYDG